MKRIMTLAAAGALGVALGAVGTAQAGTASAKEQFSTECSACHLAYQAFFLPKRSWTAIMNDLSNHFGEDASLDDASRRAIVDYLVSNAADRNGRNPRWLRQMPASEVPLRISRLSWFQHQHGSRVKNWIKNHPEVGSVSNCTACHKGADRGYYDGD